MAHLDQGDNGVYVVDRTAGGLAVRRFSSVPSTDKLRTREMAPEDVTREEVTARRQSFFKSKDGISSAFNRGKPIQG